jgi:hypothetical protein
MVGVFFFMPKYNSALEMIDTILEHNQTTQHEIISADSPMERTIGFSCVDCSSEETFWNCDLRAIKLIPIGHPLREEMPSLEARASLLTRLNQNTRDRFFVGSLEPTNEVENLELWEDQVLADQTPVEYVELERRLRLDRILFDHSLIPTRYDRKDPTDKE